MPNSSMMTMMTKGPAMTDRLLLAEGIRRALLIRNMTPGELGRRMNLNTSTPVKWVSGDSRPSPPNLTRLCRILDVSAEDVAAGLPDLPYVENN